MTAVDRVRELVLPVIEHDGVELYDIEYESGILRIMVDRPGGIDVDAIGEVSELVSQLLDDNDPFPDQRYLLEVTSPGIERRLRLPKHFASQIGEDVVFKLKVDVEGERRFQGRLVTSDAEGIEVAVDGSDDDEQRRFRYDDIESARTIFHWGEEPKKSKTKKSSSTHKSSTKKASAR